MVVFNLLIFVGGACLSATGIWVIIDGGSFIKILAPFMGDYMLHANVPAFCITLGLILVLLGTLGCCGAQKESKCLLIMFFSIIMIIFISEVASGVVSLVYCRVTEYILRNWATAGLKNKYGKDKVFTDLWNSTMTTLRCCGFNNYTDFSESYFYKQNDLLYPPTCCRTPAGYPCIEENALFSHVAGCYKKIVILVQTNVNIISAVAIGVAVIELAAMGVAIYLYCYLDDKAT